MREKVVVGSRRTDLRLWLAGVVAAVGLMALAMVPSAHAVTIGQAAPNSGALGTSCSVEGDRVQLPVNLGIGYVVPATGGVSAWTVTSWSHLAFGGGGQQLTMKVFRPVSGTDYTAVGHAGPQTLNPSALNTFPASVQVKAGDILGSQTVAGSASTACVYGSPGNTYLLRTGDLADGASGTFGTAGTSSNHLVNISAEITPTNTLTLGSITRNKKKGTATLTATVPNPGDLTASGKGVKAGATAVKSKAVGAGVAKLTIRAKGKKKAKLNDTGKVKLNTTITYTPTGGTAATVSRKVKLKKNL